MPEGPEVKRIGENLARLISGKTLENIDILSGRYIKKPPSGWTEIQQQLPTKVIGPGVHGKFLYWICSVETFIFNKSSFLKRSSSRLVPDLVISTAGKILLSEILRSNINSLLPVPLNSSKITSSILLPVSIKAVEIIVKEPPCSIFLAAPKNLLGL